MLTVCFQILTSSIAESMMSFEDVTYVIDCGLDCDVSFSGVARDVLIMWVSAAPSCVFWLFILPEERDRGCVKVKKSLLQIVLHH